MDEVKSEREKEEIVCALFSRQIILCTKRFDIFAKAIKALLNKFDRKFTFVHESNPTTSDEFIEQRSLCNARGY